MCVRVCVCVYMCVYPSLSPPPFLLIHSLTYKHTHTHTHPKGAKSINFQDLSADLAEITFKYPFRIPPYFALIIRAIGVLEGIALVGNPGFAIVDEAYPYISKRLLTDESPRLR